MEAFSPVALHLRRHLSGGQPNVLDDDLALRLTLRREIRFERRAVVPRDPRGFGGSGAADLQVHARQPARPRPGIAERAVEPAHWHRDRRALAGFVQPAPPLADTPLPLIRSYPPLTLWA